MLQYKVRSVGSNRGLITLLQGMLWTNGMHVLKSPTLFFSVVQNYPKTLLLVAFRQF